MLCHFYVKHCDSLSPSLSLSLSPNVQAFLQRQEAEKAKKETEDNRSFFQKYVRISFSFSSYSTTRVSPLSGYI